jgi:flagellar protein FlaG
MNIPPQPKVKLTNSTDYRESYANSVQIHVSVWDFLMTFGRLQAQTPELVEVTNFQSIYCSPQQAKALLMILRQNVENYEKAFGEIKLDPQMVPGSAGPVN